MGKIITDASDRGSKKTWSPWQEVRNPGAPKKTPPHKLLDFPNETTYAIVSYKYPDQTSEIDKPRPVDVWFYLGTIDYIYNPDIHICSCIFAHIDMNTQNLSVDGGDLAGPA